MKKRNGSLANILLSALFAALLSVSAYICIPLALPITAQTLVLFLAFFILGGKYSVLSVAIYISLGAIGLPVFSGFSGGISRLFDATGGYILGMLAAALIYAALEKLRIPKIPSAVVALSVIYALGTLWYSFVYSSGASSIGSVLLACVVPFIIPDTVKLLCAYYISNRIAKINR